MASAPLTPYFPDLLPTAGSVFIDPKSPYKGDSWTVGLFYCLLDTAPGAGKSVVLRLWKNGASGTLMAEVTISGTATTGVDTTITSASIVDGDYFQVEVESHDGVAADLSWAVAA